MEILIISGLSGAGKSRAASFLEDMGFYIVDNMPAAMILKFAEFCAGGSQRYDKVALVYDVRTANSPTELFDVLDVLKHSSGACSLLFLEAEPETIIKRYKETRRRHPLMQQADSLEKAVRTEQEMMEPLRQRLTALKVVFEHITTKDAADYVRDGNERLAATITPQHLMINRNHMLVGGVRPHLYCLPILKRNIHQQALRELVASGFNRVFLGTDSAPHARHRKESSCGCAGCFNAPTALGSYATVFEEMNALQHFEAFCSVNGPQFYGLPVNDTFIELVREEQQVAESIALTDDTLVPFLAGETVRWSVKQ